MSVTVKFGAKNTTMDNLVGVNIAEVRDRLEDIFNIPSGVVAQSGGRTLGDNDVVEDGMTIEFTKPVGSKA
jgi:beta-lactam-binding protein with PASTA domain